MYYHRDKNLGLEESESGYVPETPVPGAGFIPMGPGPVPFVEPGPMPIFIGPAVRPPAPLSPAVVVAVRQQTRQPMQVIQRRVTVAQPTMTAEQIRLQRLDSLRQSARAAAEAAKSGPTASQMWERRQLPKGNVFREPEWREYASFNERDIYRDPEGSVARITERLRILGSTRAVNATGEKDRQNYLRILKRRLAKAREALAKKQAREQAEEAARRHKREAAEEAAMSERARRSMGPGTITAKFDDRRLDEGLRQPFEPLPDWERILTEEEKQQFVETVIEAAKLSQYVHEKARPETRMAFRIAGVALSVAPDSEVTKGLVKAANGAAQIDIAMDERLAQWDRPVFNDVGIDASTTSEDASTAQFEEMKRINAWASKAFRHAATLGAGQVIDELRIRMEPDLEKRIEMRARNKIAKIIQDEFGLRIKQGLLGSKDSARTMGDRYQYAQRLSSDLKAMYESLKVKSKAGVVLAAMEERKTPEERRRDSLKGEALNQLDRAIKLQNEGQQLQSKMGMQEYSYDKDWMVNAQDRLGDIKTGYRRALKKGDKAVQEWRIVKQQMVMQQSPHELIRMRGS